MTPRSTPSSFTSNWNTPTSSPRTIRPVASPQPTIVNDTDADNTSSVNRRFEENILTYIQKLILVQEQNSVKIDQILNLVSQNKASCIKKPEDFPDLPLERKRDFREIEKILSESVHFNYLVILELWKILLY